LTVRTGNKRRSGSCWEIKGKNWGPEKKNEVGSPQTRRAHPSILSGSLYQKWKAWEQVILAERHVLDDVIIVIGKNGEFLKGTTDGAVYVCCRNRRASKYIDNNLER